MLGDEWTRRVEARAGNWLLGIPLSTTYPTASALATPRQRKITKRCSNPAPFSLFSFLADFRSVSKRNCLSLVESKRCSFKRSSKDSLLEINNIYIHHRCYLYRWLGVLLLLVSCSIHRKVISSQGLRNKGFSRTLAKSFAESSSRDFFLVEAATSSRGGKLSDKFPKRSLEQRGWGGESEKGDSWAGIKK